MPDVCFSFVLLFTTIIIVVTQKLVLQQSKIVTAKCTEILYRPLLVFYTPLFHSYMSPTSLFFFLFICLSVCLFASRSSLTFLRQLTWGPWKVHGCAELQKKCFQKCLYSLNFENLRNNY